MDLLIKNMEMPKECITGKNFNYEYCPLFGKCNGKQPKDEGCILVEVPPHGELIDRDYVKKNQISLNDAPVILEASE